MTRDPETIQKAIDTLEHAIDLELKKIETMRELRRALMIGKIAPCVFDGGKVRTRIEGGFTYSSFHGDVPGKDTEYVITPTEGEEVRVPLYSVPLELWPEQMVKALRFARRTTYDKLTQTTEGETNAKL